MSSFRLKNGFRLAETKHDCQLLQIISENAISSCVMQQNTPRFLEYFGSLVQEFLHPGRHFESGE